MSLGSRLIEKNLSNYKPTDGEYVEMVALLKTFPFLPKNFWHSCLLGCGAGGRGMKVKRLPLLGRMKYGQGRPRVVVLVNSLRPWFLHYNPGREETADRLISGLIRRTKRYEQYLRAINLEAKAKAGLYTPGIEKKASKPKEKATTKTKLDWSVGSVW